MVWSKGEIITSYRQSANRLKQIGILAELNSCERKDIVEILEEAGCDLPKQYKRKKAAEKAPEAPEGKDMASKKEQETACECEGMKDSLAEAEARADWYKAVLDMIMDRIQELDGVPIGEPHVSLTVERLLGMADLYRMARS